MTTVAPDWSATADEIHCPLCDYNLRGLTQPLCPECGYTFDWRDLLDPKRRHHEYVFEHYPRRNVSSFFKTITRKFRPGRFWKTLYPNQPVSGRRLFIYWLICALVAASPAVVLIGIETVPWQWYFAGGAWGSWITRLEFVLRREFWPSQHFAETADVVVHMAQLMAFLPLLMAAVLLIFQQSMRRVNVKPRHAIRCAIYSGDIVFWSGLWQLAVIFIWQDRPNPWRHDRLVLWLIILGAVVVLALSTSRLYSAYRDYMKFRDAALTVLASQLIVLIAFCIVMSQTLFYLLMS